MTDQPKRNQVSPEVLPDGEAKPDEPVKTQPLAGDGEVIESQMLKFQHGVLGCCSKPDCMCCAIFIDAYICPCLGVCLFKMFCCWLERCLTALLG